jgi:hypothetical protein
MTLRHVNMGAKVSIRRYKIRYTVSITIKMQQYNYICSYVFRYSCLVVRIQVSNSETLKDEPDRCHFHGNETGLNECTV